MPLFSRKKKATPTPVPTTSSTTERKWEDSWLRTRIDPEEVVELLHGCTAEIKSRALNVPFLLLPFRPSSDPSAARTFVRNYFYPPGSRAKLTGQALLKELRMTEVMVLAVVMKWCWARLPGGVVTWEGYQGFKIGEKDSKYARNAFATFMPLCIDSKARVQIIYDFFDLLAALAAHGKVNGLSGHKLSRYAGWWAFEHFDTGKGFDAGYKLWRNAADATCHLFFAFLRSQAPDPGTTNGILDLPRSLQQLLGSMEYPPPVSLIANDTTKVVMIVDIVSPTPFALLRRAKNFEYRDDDIALQHFSEYDDPIDALTDECRRVLRAISNTNKSQISDAKTSTSLKDASWSRFEDIGFGNSFNESQEDILASVQRSPKLHQGLNSTARSPNTDLNRPVTPSWADFLSTGFVDENGRKAPSSVLLPPDKALPQMGTMTRGQSSQSHRRDLEYNHLEPGELASIARIELDDSFWWVWISSLAGEEPVARKAAFGRCALIETTLLGGQWMVMEEQVKGAAPEQAPGAYVAERKGLFSSFTKRGRGLTRRKSKLEKGTVMSPPEVDRSKRLTLDSERQAKIQQAARELARRNNQTNGVPNANGVRRGRAEETAALKTSSLLSLGPLIKDEASPAMKWATQYDKKATREQYLGNQLAGKGSKDFLTLPEKGLGINRSVSTLSVHKELPPAPSDISQTTAATSVPTLQDKLSEPPVSPIETESAPVSAIEEHPLRALQPLDSSHQGAIPSISAQPLSGPADDPEMSRQQNAVPHQHAIESSGIFSQHEEPNEQQKLSNQGVAGTTDSPAYTAPAQQPHIQALDRIESPVQTRTPLANISSNQKSLSPPVTAASNKSFTKSSTLTSMALGNRKQSTDSKRSKMSGSEKQETEKSRNKKLGFNAPPPVTTNKVSGIRKMFGKLSNKSEQPTSKAFNPDSPTNGTSAVAAARRALEGKSRPEDGPTSPPLSPNHFTKLRDVEDRQDHAQTQPTTPMAPTTAPVSEIVPEVVHEPSYSPEQAQMPIVDGHSGGRGLTQHGYGAQPLEEPQPKTVQEFVPITVEPLQHPSVQDHYSEDMYRHQTSSTQTSQHEVREQAPQFDDPMPVMSATIRNADLGSYDAYETPAIRDSKYDEFEDLSQVDSRERAHAVNEFSRFDQDTHQGHAYPRHSDILEEVFENEAVPSFEPPRRTQHQSTYSAVTMTTDATNADAAEEKEMTPHDRWAQIRKNAAERAARVSEDRTRSRTETRTTDDGETSGEETIEARVARIKARVAELTGNMDAGRR